jgi:hypothetical protein
MAFWQPEELVFWVLFIAAASIAAMIGIVVASFATAPVRVKVVDAARGVFRIWFRNSKYRHFVEFDNDRKQYASSEPG